MPLAEGATFAGYTIVRLLGTGGMGEVYLAQHPRLPRRDALKVLPATVSADDEYRERFNREADIAATLWHPHIVGVHDRGEYDGQIWISMDYVEGTDAAQLLRDSHRTGLPPTEVVAIVRAVADALDYAHQRGLLHRDVKPANILLARPGSGEERILLADFGIARWVNDISGLTATNMTVGTVSYAAPEQLMGGELDGRADQYALAATAFHLLTGEPPFAHANPAVVISQHLSAAPPGPGVHRTELAAADPVFARALAKDPKDRFERCADFARALAHRLAGADPGATEQWLPAAAPAPARRSLLRPAVLIPAVLAVLLVVAVAVAVTEFRRADDERPAAAGTATSSAPAPPPPTTTPPITTPPITTPPITTPPTAAPPPPAVVGANCAPVGTTSTTADGTTAYCETLQSTGASIWSLTPGDVPEPTVTPAPTEEVLPFAEESPVRVCMQQTGLTRPECREAIRRSNGVPFP
ncbi:serine/threonine-protein kinase [Mycolicibacterium litorale]|uniref:non-specific serine/threonine protein kinase n=1 Tax=Mycolicibacterium litorale TaxID=758802 RepID=A0AAD1II10_9MYCO|nr:serine/threonine-protein kinase [Mycolicibacterium litorale]MCV7418865.1 serine/threonine protein kinase [Mycolicibacterium litorale]TDY00349.1 serine/threonine protein kinase [Mycolicibacterium litorale]BBY15819.1 serine/threonine-protein kinase PknF [Mycolicibacterium litorale]